ncbi:MAG: hypothetical protein ACYC6L_13245 [Anaerolineae bacterium]
MVEKKFRALRFVSGLFKVLAWINLVLGILGAFVALIAGFGGAFIANNPSIRGMMGGLTFGVGQGILGFFALLIMSLITFVVLMAISEIYQILVSLEYNTRATAYYLSGQPQNNVVPPPVQ